MISVNITVFLLLIFCLSNSNLELKFRYAKFTILHLTGLFRKLGFRNLAVSQKTLQNMFK